MLDEFIKLFDTGKDIHSDYIGELLNQASAQMTLKQDDSIFIDNTYGNSSGNPTIILGYKNRFFAFPYSMITYSKDKIGYKRCTYLYPYEVVRFEKTVWDYYPKDKVRNNIVTND